ncbi:MAG: hypothetical protein M0T83_10150, partial [Nitrospiraceae bacterium]|nr:hypothetical protein [Nitrospiraceae bacterium]
EFDSTERYITMGGEQSVFLLSVEPIIDDEPIDALPDIPDLEKNESELKVLLVQLRNIPVDDVPVGKDDSENRCAGRPFALLNGGLRENLAGISPFVITLRKRDVRRFSLRKRRLAGALRPGRPTIRFA